MKLRTFLAASCAGALVAIGCSWGTYDGSYTGGPAAGGGGNIGTATIDSTGGTVTSADGTFTLDIPSGALPPGNKLLITIQAESQQTEPNMYGPSYAVSPIGMPFMKPIAAIFHESFPGFGSNAFAVTFDRQALPLGGSMSDAKGSLVFGITSRLGTFGVMQSQSNASVAVCGGCDPTCSTTQCHSPMGCNNTSPDFATCYASCRKAAGYPVIDSCGACAKNACSARNGHTVSLVDAKNCLCVADRADNLIQDYEACSPADGATNCMGTTGGDMPDGGLPSDPGRIGCGPGGVCNRMMDPNVSCCGLSDNRICSNMLPCSNQTTCDETADCPSSAAGCCGSLLGGGASCIQGSCAGQVQYCRTNTECPSHNCFVTIRKTCKLETCDGVTPSNWPPPECL